MYYGLNRTLCDVLDEMRKLDSTKNYSSMLSLIEEAQSMANRMENKLSSVKDLEYIERKLKKKSKELRALEDQIESKS